MSVNQYLTNLASEALVKEKEKVSIRTSINHLSNNLHSYFSDKVQEKFLFGSYTRDTILTRKFDEKSDIDYMVVFQKGFKNQSYINRLREFAQKYYPESIVQQSFPAIVLRLNHIDFDLVPALQFSSLFTCYKIPGKESNEWVRTRPKSINNRLVQANKDSSSLLKPTIRLLKIWNANNNYLFPSFELEKNLINTVRADMFFDYTQLKHCFYYALNHLPNSSKTEVKRAKIIVRNTKSFERNNFKEDAVEQISKLFLKA